MDSLKVNQRFFDVQNETQEAFLPIEVCEDMPLLSLTMAVESLERIIPKSTQNARIATERSFSSVNGLSQDESGAICFYTMDSKSSDQAVSIRLNAALRAQDLAELAPYFFYLKLFLTALFKLKSVKKTIWRGAKADLSKQYPVGKTINWCGFSSCIESFDHIQSDKFLGKTGIRTLFRIECETGKAIHAHSYYQDVTEILLLPGTQLQVTDHTHYENDLCIIRLKEIRSPLAFLQQSFTSIKQIENKRYSAPLVSSTLSATKFLSSARSKSICTLSSILPVQTKVINKATKSYGSKVLKELIQKERTKESIRFSKQLLNLDDMEMIADELVSNKSWTIMYLWENYMNGKHMTILMRGLKLNSTVICLSLDGNLLGDGGVSVLAPALKTNKCLQTLCLNGNQIGESGARELANMLYVNTTLTRLELSSNCIGDDEIAAISSALKTNAYLRTIYLNQNKITELGAEYIADMLQRNKTLRSLHLASNSIGDVGVKAILQALEHNTTLETLNIGETSITVDSMHKIGKMLTMNNILKVLYLNGNNLDDDALMIIIPSLNENTTLTNLDLSMNQLTDVSADELASLLNQTHTTLTTLNISQNPLGDLGITSIADALMNNTTLVKLMLESVDITVDGVRELASMLTLNKKLSYLALNNNQIDDKSMYLLADALQYNKTLRYLYLSNCNLNDECVPFIVDIIKRNKALVSIELVKNRLTEQGKMAINKAALTNKTCSIYLDFTFHRAH